MIAGIRKFSVFSLVAALVAAYFYFDLQQYLSLDLLKQNQLELAAFVSERFALAIAIFCGVYVAVTALSLPGAAILTLAGGAIFGFIPGLILVSFSSTIGATLAFLSSRFLLRDFVQQRFREKLESINDGVAKDGAFYLFSLRLIPIFPFFLINLAMGLTPIRTSTFFFVSQLGMLAGTAAYVNAGTQLSKISSLQGILSIELILSFSVLGLLPFLAKWVIEYLKRRKHLNRFKKPRKFDYNMVVIGGGSAGLVSSYIAAAVKARVALIEKHKMGGDCLNTGCVPSKALIRSAKVFHLINRSEEFGIEVSSSTTNFQKVMERVHNTIKTIEPHDSVERYSKLGVDCFHGEAKILSPYEVKVGEKILKTKNIVIATGASPFIPRLPGLDRVSVHTSDTVWNLTALPHRLLVLGGGPIGCELAQSFARLGSKVTLVEAGSRIMPREDADVSSYVEESLKKDGINVLTNHMAMSFESERGSALVCERNGESLKIEFDEILIALGRKANTKGFGLEELGVEVSAQGTLVADPYLRTTNFENIYVCGDVTGPYQFTHTASHQAWYVAVNALFSPFKKYKVDYRVIPWCTFTDPEVARVGLSEQEALEKKISFQVTKYEIEDLDRAIADGEAKGFVKVLTAPGTDKILGATIVGAHAGEIISEYVTAMKYKIGLNKILATIHIYPTFAEANKYAAGVWKRKNAPEKILKFLGVFHRWRRN